MQKDLKMHPSQEPHRVAASAKATTTAAKDIAMQVIETCRIKSLSTQPVAGPVLIYGF